MPGPELRTNDVRLAADFLVATLRPYVHEDWSRRAYRLDWSARYTLEHTLAALESYAGRLALRAPGRVTVPSRTPAEFNRFSPYTIDDLFVGLAMRAAVLAEVAAAAPPDVRAWHPAGMADGIGFVGMGCVEILTHTDDIARAFGDAPDPPVDLCGRVVRRMFPWAPTDVQQWDALLWATGRFSLAGVADTGPNWSWLTVPLAEWDGEICRDM